MVKDVRVGDAGALTPPRQHPVNERDSSKSRLSCCVSRFNGIREERNRGLTENRRSVRLSDDACLSQLYEDGSKPHPQMNIIQSSIASRSYQLT